MATLANLAIADRQGECLQVLSQFTLELNGRLSAHAAKTGQLSCLGLLRELGDSLSEGTAILAAKHGTAELTSRPVMGCLQVFAQAQKHPRSIQNLCVDCRKHVEQR